MNLTILRINVMIIPKLINTIKIRQGFRLRNRTIIRSNYSTLGREHLRNPFKSGIDISFIYR